jgi:hypothetical protein
VKTRWATLPLMLLLAGCGEPPVFPVQGKVEFTDGGDPAPLAGYVVTFRAEDQTKTSAEGRVLTDGSFTLSSFVLGENDGTVPGRHQIALTPPPATSEGRRPPPVIDAKYWRFETSGLSAEVRREPTEVLLKVERAAR